MLHISSTSYGTGYTDVVWIFVFVCLFFEKPVATFSRQALKSRDGQCQWRKAPDPFTVRWTRMSDSKLLFCRVSFEKLIDGTHQILLTAGGDVVSGHPPLQMRPGVKRHDPGLHGG